MKVGLQLLLGFPSLGMGVSEKQLDEVIRNGFKKRGDVLYLCRGWAKQGKLSLTRDERSEVVVVIVFLCIVALCGVRAAVPKGGIRIQAVFLWESSIEL